MRESKHERYLHRCVAALGGITIKVKYPGRRHAPDRLILFPPHVYFMAEMKATGKKPSRAQQREHKRLEKYGAHVFIPNSILAVDKAIEWMREIYYERTGCRL